MHERYRQTDDRRTDGRRHSERERDRFRDEGLTIKRYINSSVYFTLLYWD